MNNPQENKNGKHERDLPDSPDDVRHLQPDEGVFEMPDVKDIPGQEHVRPMPLGELADTTISSADEEGKGLFGEQEPIDPETDVTPEERELLRQTSVSMATPDDVQLQRAQLDKKDDDGEPLNEKIDQSGTDLDVPGTDEDDSTEDDEENSQYSLNDDKEDPITTRQ